MVAYLIEILSDGWETIAVCLSQERAHIELIRYSTDDPMNIYRICEMEITQ